MSTDATTLPGYWLNEASDEFHQLKHYLLMCTPSVTIDNIEVWKIDNLEVNGIYERRAAGLLRVSTWVDPADIEGGTIEDVSRSGFNFTESGGMVFETGVVRFPNTLKGEFNERVLLYTEAAVGRSFVYDGNPGMRRIPAGYNSFYLPSQPLDRNKDGEFSLEEYHAAAQFDGRDPSEYNHRYFVQEPQQACPKYIVRFQYTSGAGMPHATENGETFEYFDPVDYKPVSLRDKMMGQSDSRRLITSEQAYRQAILECEKEDNLLSGKKAWLEQQLTDVDETLREINLNYATCHETLTSAYQNSVSQLQSMTKQKLDCILSAELELRRQYEQVLWGESFISNQVGLGGGRVDGPSLHQKVDFLRVWKAHVVHRNAVCRFKTNETDVLKSMKPDIVVDVAFQVGKKGDIADSSGSPGTVPDKDWHGKNQQPNRLSKRATTMDGEPIESASESAAAQRPAAAYVEHANKIGLFDNPILSAEDLVATSAKQLIDASSAKLRDAVAEATKDTHSKYQLPPSFTAPFASGMVYPVPGTINLGEEDRHDGKQQFEAMFKKTIGGPETPQNGRDSSLDAKNQNSTSPWLFGDQSADVNFTSKPPTDKRGTAERSGGASSGKPKDRLYQPSVRPADDISQSLGPMTSSSRAMQNLPVSARKPSNRRADNNRELSMDALEEVAAAHAQFSVKTVSERKQKQLGSAVKSISPSDVFCDSVVLSKESAKDIYFTLPFFTKPPQCKLLYSTAMHRRSLDSVYKSCAQNPSAVVLLIRSSHFCFGAYLSHPLIPSASWVGSPACYLFSSTLDVRLPYHGRRPPDSSGAASTPKAFFVDQEYVEIGNGDLFIDQTLSAGRSEIEGCYGVGLSIGSPESQCLLAGQPEFVIDELEVWSV